MAARGAKILSYSITIDGYDSMSSVMCTQDEVDPGTEKARENAERKAKENREKEEKIKERRAAKRAEEEKLEAKSAEKRAEKRAAEEVRIESGEYTINATGTDVKAVTQSVVSAALGTSAPMGVSFDVKA